MNLKDNKKRSTQSKKEQLTPVAKINKDPKSIFQQLRGGDDIVKTF